MEQLENQRPVVSIYCLTYNHELYIRDCLEGFVNQQTDFPFEVIVHDDASTDGTQNIIREYETKYPNMIKGIYQTENQYAKKVPKVRQFIFPKVLGKYVAVCEGDDYWVDMQKLQLQVKAMEDHIDCHFCVCGVQEVSVNKRPLGVIHPNERIDSALITPEEFVRYAGTYSFQTSSYMMRYEDWKEYILNPPEFRKASDIGDLPMLLYFGSLGQTVYIDRVMSCYRRGAAASYSAKKNNWDENKRIKHFEKQMKVWRLFDSYTNGKHHSVCTKKVSQNMFGFLILQKKASDFFTTENKEYFLELPFAKKCYIYGASIFRGLFKRHYINSMINTENKELALWGSK